MDVNIYPQWHNHISHVRTIWNSVSFDHEEQNDILLNGETLSLGQLVSLARFKAKASILESSDIVAKMEKSFTIVKEKLDRNGTVYGVNTGCGANADTRTTFVETLQQAYLQHQHSGILPGTYSGNDFSHGCHPGLPEEIVRGALVVRCNTLVRGHSGIRMQVLKNLLRLSHQGLLPVIPVRGSVSASGDLSPLSYFGGLLEGNPSIFVRTSTVDSHSRLMSADEALHCAGIEPTHLQAKEGMAIMNGTAPSAAAAALVLYDSHNLAILTQVVVGMAAEALLGQYTNFHPFISQCRPHPGQTEVAQNLRNFLYGSKLCGNDGVLERGLAQDRYPLRTAAQWIGPQLEDLMLADRQITTELNCTTDNPLVDCNSNEIYHGGNFQATSITSAMEKVRTSLTSFGRLLLAISTELVNPAMSKGLPPNLCADDPSISFTCKGVDINMAAYFSELASLTTPVTGVVQSTDMGNQSINSLALLSARLGGQAIELTTMMMSAAIYMLCQAVDLRARDEDFLTSIRPVIEAHFKNLYEDPGKSLASTRIDFEEIWTQLQDSWSSCSQSSLQDRCQKVTETTTTAILRSQLISKNDSDETPLSWIRNWNELVYTTLCESYESNNQKFFEARTTQSYVSSTTNQILGFVREDLDVPFHRGIVDHPPLCSDRISKTIGSYITRIYEAIKDGSLVRLLQKVLERGTKEMLQE